MEPQKDNSCILGLPLACLRTINIYIYISILRHSESKTQVRFLKLDSGLPSYIGHGLFQLMPKLVVNFTHLTMTRVDTKERSSWQLGNPNSNSSLNLVINPLKPAKTSEKSMFFLATSSDFFATACCFCSWQKSRVVSHSRSTCVSVNAVVTCKNWPFHPCVSSLSSVNMTWPLVMSFTIIKYHQSTSVIFYQHVLRHSPSFTMRNHHH